MRLAYCKNEGNHFFCTWTWSWTWTGHGEPGPHVQVQVRRVAGPDLKFRSRFGLEKPEPGPNWTVASIQDMLPETVFSGPGGTPQLRCLSLTECSVSWESKFMCSLTHLTIVQVPTACRLPVNDLITNLGHMPQLESIHLSSVLAPLEHSELNAFS